MLCMIGRHACNPVCTGGQVRVVDFKERGEGEKVLVEVHIIVEAASQRGIIIGKGGSALKALGTAARADIEEFLGAPPPPCGPRALQCCCCENWKRSALAWLQLVACGSTVLVGSESAIPRWCKGCSCVLRGRHWLHACATCTCATCMRHVHAHVRTASAGHRGPCRLNARRPWAGRSVYLDLTVKVNPKWRKDERLVSAYGA